MAEGFYITNRGIELINSAVPSESKVEIIKARFGSGGDAVSTWNYDITDVVTQVYEKRLDPETDSYKVSDTDPKSLMISVTVPPEETCTINEVGFFDEADNLIVYGIVRQLEKPAGVKYQYDCWIRFDNVDTANVEIKIVSSEFEKVEKLVEDTKAEFERKIQHIETTFNIENYPTNEDIAALDNKFSTKQETKVLSDKIDEFTGGETLSEYLKKSEASNTYLNKLVAQQTYLDKNVAQNTYLTKEEFVELKNMVEASNAVMEEYVG